MAEDLGDVVDIHGQRMAAFPGPSVLLDRRALATLPELGYGDAEAGLLARVGMSS